MSAPTTIPIIPMIEEPPFGKWSARAEFDFDVFAAVEPLAVLLAVPLVALVVVVLAADEDVEFVGLALPIVEDVTQDDVEPSG